MGAADLASRGLHREALRRLVQEGVLEQVARVRYRATSASRACSPGCAACPGDWRSGSPLPGAVAFVAAFLSGAPGRTLGVQLLDALEMLFELLLAVAGIILVSVLVRLTRLDGLLAAASQRLDGTGRPPVDNHGS